MANEIPVYMITGFLEGGKTSFLKFTLQQDYFNDGSKMDTDKLEKLFKL